MLYKTSKYKYSIVIIINYRIYIYILRMLRNVPIS